MFSYYMEDLLEWLWGFTVMGFPQVIIGLFSVLYPVKRKTKRSSILCSILYFTMIALSAVSCLNASTFGFAYSLHAYIGAEYARAFIYFVLPALLAVQLVLLAVFFKKKIIRKILFLTLLFTPGFIMLLMGLAAELFGEGLYMS